MKASTPCGHWPIEAHLNGSSYRSGTPAKFGGTRRRFPRTGEPGSRCCVSFGATGLEPATGRSGVPYLRCRDLGCMRIPFLATRRRMIEVWQLRRQLFVAWDVAEPGKEDRVVEVPRVRIPGARKRNDARVARGQALSQQFRMFCALGLPGLSSN